MRSSADFGMRGGGGTEAPAPRAVGVETLTKASLGSKYLPMRLRRTALGLPVCFPPGSCQFQCDTAAKKGRMASLKQT